MPKPVSPMGLQVFFRPFKGFLAQLLHSMMNSDGFAKDRRFFDRATPRQPPPALQSRPNPDRP
jgi:hypothetical protein